MKKPVLSLIMLLAGAAIVLGGQALLGRSSKGLPSNAANLPVPNNTKSPLAIAAKPKTLEFAASDLFTVSLGDLERTVALTGSLRAANHTIVKSKSSGEIKELLVKEGSPVIKGQLLAVIDPIELQWRVREREAQVRSAQASWDQAKRSFDNNKALVEKNFISQTALENSRAQLDAATSNRDAANANLTLAQRALTDTRIVAPIAGTVGERFAQAGEKISPDNRLLSILDMSTMEAEFNVAASDVGTLQVGQSLQLTIEASTEKRNARLVRISPSASAGSRTVPVFVQLDGRDSSLRAGLFVQAQLPVQKKSGVVSIPWAAVREAAGRSFVYAIKAGKLEERTVILGLRDDNARAPNGATSSGLGSTGMVEVLGGLEIGDLIVASNLGALSLGADVKPVATQAEVR